MRKRAFFTLVGIIFVALYCAQWIMLRQALHQEKERILKTLDYFSTQQARTAQDLFAIKGDTTRLRDWKVTSYSSLGFPKQTDSPPLPGTMNLTFDKSIRPVWKQNRWYVNHGNLWFETIFSDHSWPSNKKGASNLIGFATLFNHKGLLPENSDVQVVATDEKPSGFVKLFSQSIELQGENSLQLHPPVIVLTSVFGLWRTWFTLILSFLIALVFVRVSKPHTPRNPKRERQLEEELAYLSRTYQNLSKSLRMEREKVETILNSAPDGIFTCYPDGKITFWNRSMEKLTGLPKEHAVGKYYGENLNILSSSGQVLADPFSACLIDGNSLNLLDCRIEIASSAYVLSAGKSLPVALGAAPVRNSDGSIQEIVVTVKDIQAQKEVEQMKKDLQAMITHDLRSPLSAMLGYAGLIQDQRMWKNEEDRQKYLDSLVRTGKGMLVLINNLLGWAGTEGGGKLVLHKDIITLKPLLEEVVESFSILAQPKNLSIAVEANPHSKIMADVEKLKEILMNLLSNAIKFSRNGEKIRVMATEDMEAVRISVIDAGPGLSPEEIEKLFEKFSGVRKKGSGTGLGLYIVKTLATSLGGSVEVTSQEGVGSMFTVVLPPYRKAPVTTPQLKQLSLTLGPHES